MGYRLTLFLPSIFILFLAARAKAVPSESYFIIFFEILIFLIGNIEKRKIHYFSKMGFTLYDSLSSVNLEATHVAVFVKLNLWLLEHFEIAMSFSIA